MDDCVRLLLKLLKPTLPVVDTCEIRANAGLVDKDQRQNYCEGVSRALHVLDGILRIAFEYARNLGEQ